MKELRFEGLNAPEYYHEIPDVDSRIAIRKFLDARDTMGYARMSLSFIDDAQTDDFEKNFIKAIHLRHAIVDLNNSFDLLLQIPWIFYRAWKEFNYGGSLRSRNYKNRNDIVRNTTDWVYKAERECSDRKLFIYLDNINNLLKKKIEDFQNQYIANRNKSFTIRSLCNTMKHNHILSFSELYQPYDFTVNINGVSSNLRDRNLGIRYEQQFYIKDNPNEILGIVKTSFSNDLAIDIDYVNGDEFRFIDCTHNTDMLKIVDVFKECTVYYDAIVDLFEEIYDIIYLKICPCLSLNKPNIKQGNGNIDLTKYFTVC